MRQGIYQRHPAAVSLDSQRGMSAIELVICLCVMAVVAAVFIPAYITYTQQARVLALVLPRLQQLESNITLIYLLEKRLPSSSDLPALMSGISHENLDIELSNGVITLTVNAPDSALPIHILDGTTLVASPVIGTASISAWHLDGELAQRLGISQ